MNKYNKAETDSQIQRTNYWLPEERGSGEGLNSWRGLRGANYSFKINKSQECNV